MSHTETVSDLAVAADAAQRMIRAREIAQAMLMGVAHIVRPKDASYLFAMALGLIADQIIDGALPGCRAELRESVLGLIATMTEEEGQ